MTEPAPPQRSPDGYWWWTGVEWVPAADVPEAAAAEPNAAEPEHEPDPEAAEPAAVAPETRPVSTEPAPRRWWPEARDLWFVALAALGLWLLMTVVGALRDPEPPSDAAVKRELRRVAAAEQAFRADQQRFADLEELIRSTDYLPAPGVTVEVLRFSASGYCLKGIQATATWYLDSTAGKVATTPC